MTTGNLAPGELALALLVFNVRARRTQAWWAGRARAGDGRRSHHWCGGPSVGAVVPLRVRARGRGVPATALPSWSLAG